MKLKKMFNILFIFSCLILITNLDNVKAGSNDQYIKNITIENNGGHVGIGHHEEMNIDVDMYNGFPNFNGEIEWSSSDTKIATVEKKSEKRAIIEGVSDGVVTIKACIKGVNKLCSSVALAVGSAKKPALKDLKIDAEPYNIGPGDRESFKVEVDCNPGHTFKGGIEQDDFISWYSTDEDIASVVWQSEQHAKIYGGHKQGTAVIYGCTNRGVCASTQIYNKGEHFELSVNEDKISGISLEKSIVNMKVGDVERFKVNVYSDAPSSSFLPAFNIQITPSGNDNHSDKNKCISVTQIDNFKYEIRAFKICEEKPTVTISLSTRPDIKGSLDVNVKGTINGSINVDGTTTGKVDQDGNIIDKIIDTSDKEYTCEELLDQDLIDVIHLALKWIRIGIPIALIVLITIDFGSAVISNDQDAIKKATSKAIKRAIAAVAVFFIPLIVDVLINMVNESDSFNPNKNNCTEVLK